MKQDERHAVPTRLVISTLIAASGLLWAIASAQADESLFGYSYGSEVLPKGIWEFEQWATWRTDKGNGTYNALDLKEELEYGVTDRFQTALYLNFQGMWTHDTGPVDDQGQFEIPNQSGVGFQGVSMEFKYALLSPYKDPVGLAFYLEPGYSRLNKITGVVGTEYEVEAKAILQKNFLDDQLVTVLNLTGEFEWERFPSDSPNELELKLELTGGVAYRFAPNWYAGLEARYQAIYPNMNLGNNAAWAFFAGPAIHYATKSWWATLTVLPQIVGNPTDPGRSSHLQLDEFETLEVRLKVGIYF
jgi:hypothetical protein